MSTSTQNYGFTKPDPSEYYDVGVFNKNFDDIDAAIKEAASSGSGTISGYSTSEDTSITMEVIFDEETMQKFGDGTVGAGTLAMITFRNGWHPWKNAPSSKTYLSINNTNYQAVCDGHDLTDECMFEAEKNGIITFRFDGESTFFFITSSSNSTPGVRVEPTTVNSNLAVLLQTASACKYPNVLYSNRLLFNPNTNTLTLNGSLSVSNSLTSNFATVANTLTAGTVISNTFKSTNIEKTSTTRMKTYPGAGWDIYVNTGGVTVQPQFAPSGGQSNHTYIKLIDANLRLSGSSSIISSSSCALIDVEGSISTATYFKSKSPKNASTTSTSDRLPNMYGGLRCYPVLSTEPGNVNDNFSSTCLAIRYEHYSNGGSSSVPLENQRTYIRIGDYDLVNHLMLNSRNAITLQTFANNTNDKKYSCIAFRINDTSTSSELESRRATQSDANLILRSSCMALGYRKSDIHINGVSGSKRSLDMLFSGKTTYSFANPETPFADFADRIFSADDTTSLAGVITHILENSPTFAHTTFLFYPGEYIIKNSIEIDSPFVTICGYNQQTILRTSDGDTDGVNNIPIINLTSNATHFTLKNITLRHGDSAHISHGPLMRFAASDTSVDGDTTTGTSSTTIVKYNYLTIDNVQFINTDKGNLSSRTAAHIAGGGNGLRFTNNIFAFSNTVTQFLADVPRCCINIDVSGSMDRVVFTGNSGYFPAYEPSSGASSYKIHAYISSSDDYSTLDNPGIDFLSEDPSH